MTNSTNGTGNLIDEFEEAFQQYLHLFIQENGLESCELVLPLDQEGIESEIDQTAMRFLDFARQVEAFFSQKRFLLTALKPELIVKEEITDSRVELLRKEELIKKHQDKIYIWQNLLAEMHGWVNTFSNTSQGVPAQNTPNGGISVTNIVQHQMHQQLDQIQQSAYSHQNQISQQIHQQQVHQNMMNTNNSQGSGMLSTPQGVFVNQGGIIPSRQTPFQAGISPNSILQGPLAFLEKTTSNIGMPDRSS